METIKCIKERRSVRSFAKKQIDKEIINEIVDAASFAPSWKNTQIARYIIIQDRAVIDKIADEAVMGFKFNTNTLKQAPVLVIETVVTGLSGFEADGSYSTSKEDRWENFDAGIAAQTFCLAARDKGIGTVIMGIFDEYKVAEIIDIPDPERIVAFIAMGYPEGDFPKSPKRFTSDELITFI